MAETLVDWLINKLFGKNGLILFAEVIEEAKEKHKEECIKFAEQWELRCNEKDMDSKEQLYDKIYKSK